jgi:hypothetical protein
MMIKLKTNEVSKYRSIKYVVNYEDEARNLKQSAAVFKRRYRGSHPTS